jgi:hypothetical protein
MLTEIIVIAIIAYVYQQILTEPDMILEWWYNLCKKRLPKFLFDPVVGCVYCVAGQMSLWYYLATRWNNYNFIHHIAFICITIFCIEIIMTIKNKTK